MDKTLIGDIDSFTLPSDIVDKLRDSRIVITGATGLVGLSIVRCLSRLDIGVSFILPVRNARKYKSLADELPVTASVVETDLMTFFDNADFDCDYIIHCASPTDGSYMQEHPVETYMFAVDSTKSILDYCRRHPVKSVVYLSSIEYYGQIFNDDPVVETSMGHIDHQSPRNSYALGKQSAEYLCVSYAKEYGVPAKIARLTQTFGAGIQENDKRVFAQFARRVIEGKDIELHTEGLSAKPYVYTTDCVAALMYILTKGDPGEPYNVATPGTYISIRDLAYLFRDNFAPGINVVVDVSKANGYAAHTRVNMDSSKIMALGWRPRYGLTEMVARLIDYMKTK